MEVGNFYLVRYRVAGVVVHHERLVLALAASGLWAAILTPDYDLYVETCVVDVVDVQSVCLLVGQGAPADGITAARCYRFAALPDSHVLVGYFASGAALLGVPLSVPPFVVKLGRGNAAGRRAGNWELQLQLPAVPVDPLVAAPALAPAAPPARVDAGVDGLLAALGGAADADLPSGGLPVVAAPAVPVVPPAAPAPLADHRLLPGGRQTATQGLGGRDFREALRSLRETEVRDWGVRGPRTTLWCLRHMGEHAGTPVGWHNRWVANHRLNPTEYGIDVHETACRFLQTLVCVDGVNAPDLESAEVVARQLQLVEERHRDKKGVDNLASSVDSHLYMGASSASRGGDCICPMLQEWIAEELRRESGVLKERRKAREEREFNKDKKNGK